MSHRAPPRRRAALACAATGLALAFMLAPGASLAQESAPGEVLPPTEITAPPRPVARRVGPAARWHAPQTYGCFAAAWF